MPTLQRCPDLGIAGGLLRDLYTKQPYKDVDLWLAGGSLTSQEKEERAWSILMGMGLMGYLREVPDRDSPTAHRPGVLFNAVLANGIPIQLIYGIFVPNGKILISRFDYTVCQIAGSWNVVDGTFTTVVGPQFVSDIRSRTLRYNWLYHDFLVGGGAGSLSRLFKLAGRGYVPDTNSTARLLAKATGRIRDGSVRGKGNKESHKAWMTNSQDWRSWKKLIEEPEEYRPGNEAAGELGEEAPIVGVDVGGGS